MSQATINTPQDIRAIVQQVIAELRGASAAGTPTQRLSPVAPVSFAGRHGIFASVDEAVRASQEAFEQLEKLGLEGRRKAIAHIRRISIDDSAELGRMEFEETKIGVRCIIYVIPVLPFANPVKVSVTGLRQSTVGGSVDCRIENNGTIRRNAECLGCII